MIWLETRNKNPQGMTVRRVNKTARGMSETLHRHHPHRFGLLLDATPDQALALLERHAVRSKEQKDDARRLAVRGTLDTLRGLTFCIKRNRCRCCGSHNAGPVILNDTGRARLRAARRRLGKDPGAPTLPVYTIRTSPSARELRDLLRRAADRLQELSGEAHDDLNDPLAMEIYRTLGE
jgi:hypothetical protein